MERSFKNMGKILDALEAEGMTLKVQKTRTISDYNIKIPDYSTDCIIRQSDRAEIKGMSSTVYGVILEHSTLEELVAYAKLKFARKRKARVTSQS